MKKTLVTVLVILLVALVAVATWWAIDSNSSTDTNTPASQQAADTEAVERLETLQYQGEDGKTALELLQENAEVDMQGEGEMAFVSAINGVEAGDDEFWSFLVNGEMASVGAGSYETSSSDTITWELQAIDPSFSEDTE